MRILCACGTYNTCIHTRDNFAHGLTQGQKQPLCTGVFFFRFYAREPFMRNRKYYDNSINDALV